MGIHCCDVTILGKESFAIGVELKGCDLIATFVGALFRFFAFSLLLLLCCRACPTVSRLSPGNLPLPARPKVVGCPKA